MVYVCLCLVQDISGLRLPTAKWCVPVFCVSWPPSTKRSSSSAKAHAVLLCQQICSAQYFGALRSLGSFWTWGLPPFGEGSSGIFRFAQSMILGILPMQISYDGRLQTSRDCVFLCPKRGSKVWDLCGLALLLADAILLPLSLAWDWHQGTDEAGSFFLLVVFLLSLLFWSVDICMNLNTAFYQRGFLVFSRWEILKHYLQTWCLDSIGCADQ